MRYAFHPEALDEFEKAVRFYAGRQPGLEVRFVDHLAAAFESICEEPERWRLFEKDVRRYLVHVFPYAVLYSIETEFILIIAVMHCSREPRYWRHRLE